MYIDDWSKYSFVKKAVYCLFAVHVTQAATASVPMHTKDITGVSMNCKSGSFIVSLNDDDDNNNKTPDLNEKGPSKLEDNLRPITLTAEGAKFVTLNPPSNPKRIRAYFSDRATPLSFNKSYPTPLNFYVEGISPSRKEQDFNFEYTFISDKGEEICTAKAAGTVINVKATFEARGGTDKSRFDKTKKILATGNGIGKGLWKPLKKPQIIWAYDGTATLTPTKAPTKIKFTAGTTITAAGNLNGDDITAKLTYQKQTIIAHTPVNITAPVHAITLKGWTDGSNADTKYFDANKGYVGLFNRYVKYRLQDQFRQPITASARGGKNIKIRENIRAVMTSPLPRVRQWIAQKLNATDNWKEKNGGVFTDRLRVQQLPKSKLLRAAGRFHPSLLANGAAVMNLGGNTHQWSTSIDGNAATVHVVTDNTFTVVVGRYNPRPNHTRGPAIFLRSNYGVVVR